MTADRETQRLLSVLGSDEARPRRRRRPASMRSAETSLADMARAVREPVPTRVHQATELAGAVRDAVDAGDHEEAVDAVLDLQDRMAVLLRVGQEYVRRAEHLPGWAAEVRRVTDVLTASRDASEHEEVRATVEGAITMCRSVEQRLTALSD